MPNKHGSETDPVILRDCSFELIKAIVVFVAKECGYKTITPKLMLFTIGVLTTMCEKEV